MKPSTSIRAWDKDELIRDLKLCKNPEGLIGYYDLISEKFFVLDGFKEREIDEEVE